MKGSSVRNPRYVAVLAITSVAILAIGTTVRRAIDTGTPEPPAPSESDLLRLARSSQRQSLEDMTAYLRSVADQAQRSLVSLPDLSATGILGPDGVVITAGTKAPIDGAAVSGPQHAIAALTRPEPDTERAVLRDDAGVLPGEWIVAAWRNGAERPYAGGTVAGTATVACGQRPVRTVLTTVALNRAMAGAGLFDVHGRLLAIILTCDGAPTAVSVGDVEAMLKAGRTDEGQVLSRFGMRAGGLTPAETIYFNQPAGVIIREVWDGSSAANADLRPGDLVQSVNGAAVATPQDFHGLLLATNDSVRVGVRRRGVTVTTDVPTVAPAADRGTGLTWRSSEYPIDVVQPDSPASRAGVRAGDVVVRIDQVEPRTLAEVQRRLGAGRPPGVLLEVRRDRLRWCVLLS